MNCLSLFSGCGGLDLGLKQAGFNVVLATDSWELSEETHAQNFPEARFICDSITGLSGDRISKRIGRQLAGNIDILAGGPPCPPFSKSRFYRKDKPRALADPVGQETLLGYLRLLEDLRPATFLFENVHGFAYKVHREAFDFLTTTAEQLGYACNSAVLNAADYGVPQIRQRFFMNGSLRGPIAFPKPTHEQKAGSDLFSGSLLPWVTAGEAIGDLDTEKNASDEGHYAGGKYNHLLKEIPPGDNYLYFTARRGHPRPVFEWRSRYWSFLLKLSPDLPSWTIQARRSNNMGPLHWRNRILRIGEVMRLQSFPDDFFVSGKTEDQWRQIGNAVPPKLAKALGLAIAEHLSSSADGEERFSASRSAVV